MNQLRFSITNIFYSSPKNSIFHYACRWNCQFLQYIFSFILYLKKKKNSPKKNENKDQPIWINTLLLQNTGHMMGSGRRNLYQTLVFLSCNNGHVVNETQRICHTARRQSENTKQKGFGGWLVFS